MSPSASIVQLMASDRPLFALGDRLGGSDAEVRAAFEGYHAYFGRYSVDQEAGAVHHDIEVCVGGCTTITLRRGGESMNEQLCGRARLDCPRRIWRR